MVCRESVEEGGNNAAETELRTHGPPTPKVPPVYVWIWAYHSEWNERLVLMGVLSTLWGIRLTLNFARKGGYSGEEDCRFSAKREIRDNPNRKGDAKLTWTLFARARRHTPPHTRVADRWAVLQKTLGKGFVWQLFNIGFISLYQMGLIFAFCIPAYRAVVNDSPLIWLDYVCAAAFLLLLVCETISDEQQWQYYAMRTKARKKAAEGDDSLLVGDYKRGFLTSGLFRYSRHPNFFCEQSQCE